MLQVQMEAFHNERWNHSVDMRKSTWEFTIEDLEASLYGGFKIKPDIPDYIPKSPAEVETGYNLTPIENKLELPSNLPEGIRIVKGIHNNGSTHYGAFCCQSVIPKGTRLGPYCGKIIQPSEVEEYQDNAYLWEVYRDGVLSHYIDGSYDPENWMKFVNCARHEDEQTLVVVQDGERIYYEACRDVYEGEELLVWYGDMYEMFLGIPVGIRTRTKKDQPKLQPEGSASSFSCERCGKVFAYKYYRDRHLKYTRCVDHGDRKFPCTLCDRSFDKRDRLRIHILHVHEKHRPHECSECGKRFSQSSSLNKHLRVHSGVRPYKCPHCVKAFTASSILRTHIRQHSGEKPFKCRHCGRAFASHAAHDSHVRRTHTKEKPCVCSYCGKAFAQSYELKFHINMHTGQKPYTCEKCGRGFSSPSSRDRHRSNFDCTTRKNRAPKVMRKNQMLVDINKDETSKKTKMSAASSPNKKLAKDAVIKASIKW